MSLILEALKKSERQRQIGVAPTLATPAMARRRPSNLLPWLLAAILIAGGVGWWLSRDIAPPPVAGTSPASGEAVPQAAPAEPDPPITTQAPPPQAAVPPPPPPSAPPASDESRVKEMAAAVAAATPPPPAAPPADTAPTPEQIPPPPAAAPAEMPRTSPTPTAPAVAQPAAEQPAPPTDAAPASPSPAQGLPLLWELPYEQRRNIPALTLSLQVYSDDPARRFAIVNDERRKEGDTLADGLVLREIVPEGLIVEYAGQRFLYPRGGR